jgi:glycosyltransferase involved in cell wall biosynthesis
MGKNNKPVTHSIQDIFVSTIVVLRPESQKIDEYILDLYTSLSVRYTNYEIIIVDNEAPTDEFNGVVALLDKVPCIRVIKLSQQFRYDTAVFAGLDVSIGDYVCTLDPMIDPVKDMPLFIEKNRSHDVVQGVSDVPITGVFGSQLGRRLFYWYNRKYIGINIPLNATYYASYSRRAINSLTSSGRNHRHIRHLARRIGYGYITQDYTPVHNPSSQRSLRTGVVEALEIVTSYSTHPLRFVTWLGFIASIVNVLYAFYVLILNLFSSSLAPGWTSTSMQLSLMFFILFIIMIILAEYIGRILTESHHDPNYFVADELVSTTAIADVNRRNITK